MNAFPMSEEGAKNLADDLSDGSVSKWDHYFRQATQGMSLRDYFAAKAMQGAIASMSESEEFDAEIGATWCYQIADAMLKAREK